MNLDWKLLASTYLAVFIAELGDKTQLATLSLAAESRAGTRWVVFVASALALVTSSLIAVLAGDAVARFVSPVWLRRIAGAVFVVMGAFFLLKRAD